MVLITSAAGKVGQPLLEALVARGVRVRAGVHSPDRARALQRAGLEPIVLDFDRPATLAAAFAGVAEVFLSAPGSPAQPTQEHNLLRAAQAAGVRRIVKLSILGAEAEATTFGRWNRISERALQASGIAWTILRPNMFMQDLLARANLIREQGGFSDGPASMRISMIDCRDIASVAAAALTESGHAEAIYELHGPEVLTFPKVAAILSRVLGRPVAYWERSMADFERELRTAGLPAWLVAACVDLAAEVVRHGAAGSSSDVERVLHRAPIAFERFALDHRSAFQ
jgi:uncharacterized protein YbjT (DUF2867 family)